MLEFRPCHGEHIKYLDVQSVQRKGYQMSLREDELEALTSGVSLSAWHNSRCVGAAGFVHFYRHRAVAWMLLSKDAAPHMLAIARKIRRVLDLDPTPRIEMTVDVEFKEGQRFAELIGMTRESGILRKHGMLGEDEIMYARIK